MRKLLLLLAVMAGAAHAQTGFFYGQALGNNPFNNGMFPIGNAQVRVCSAGATGSPCAPTAEAAGTPITDISGNQLAIIGGNFGQLSADINGRFNFGCPTAGSYLVQVATTANNTTQNQYKVSCGIGSSTIGFVGVPTGACGATQLAVNTNNGNLYSCNGSVWIATVGGTPGGANTQIQINNSGAFGAISNVAPGSVLASQGAATLPAFQTKRVIDVRDIAGVDCTGVADSATALTAFTGNPPTTNNALNQKTLSFGRCPQIKLTSTWVVYNQAGFIIDGLTRSGSGSQGVNISWAGAANGIMIDFEYVDGFLVQGLNIQGNTTAGVGINVDKNGAGGIWNTTDGRFVNITVQGANQNWAGMSISPISGSNVEDIRIEDSTFYCNATRATTNGVGIMIGQSANAKNEIIKHTNITQCFYGIWQKSGSMQVRDSEMTTNGGTCGSGTGADIRIDGTTDVDIIEGNLDENSTQGINQNNDAAGANPTHPIIVRGNHAAPAGCQNLGVFWYNTGKGAAPWIFEGDSWDQDATLTKVIGTSPNGSGGVIYTRGLLYPNSTFIPWWTNYTTAIADDLAIEANKMRALKSVSGVVPAASTNLQSPYEVFRGYVNGSTSTPDDFAVEGIPAGTTGTTGGTFVIKHQQGTTGTQMFGWDGSYPGITMATVPTPGPITVTPTGGTGATSYTYAVVAFSSIGNTPASATQNIGNGVAGLSSSTYNLISWFPVTGAIKYCVWRTVGGGSTGNIGCTSAILTLDTNLTSFGYTVNASGVAAQYQFKDTGLTGDSAALPTLNTTGVVNLIAGTSSTPSLTLGTDTAGMFQSTANIWGWQASVGHTSARWAFASALWELSSAGGYIWNSANSDFGGSFDTGLFRSAAGQVEVSNSSSPNSSGTLKVAGYFTDTNCQLGGASGTTSPAACGSAASGAVAIPASQTTYTVNTTAVTVNSHIIVQQITDNSGISTATCNAGVTAPVQSTRSAATSFTFTLTSVASVTCFQYWIID
jgi:hypothetical protein